MHVAPPAARFRRSLLAACSVLAIAIGVAAATATATIPTVSMRGAERISSVFSRDASIAAGSGNRISAAWAQIGSPATGVYVSDLKFGSWTVPVKVAGSQDGESVRIAMSPNGRLIVSWQVEHGDPRSGSIGVALRSPAGVWGPTQYLGSTDGDAINTDAELAINDAGRAVVAWTHTGSSRTVEAAFATNGTFGAAQTVDTGSSAPSVAMDLEGRAIILYGKANYEVRQALAPAAGTFGAPTTIDPIGPGENDVSNNMRVRSNSAGTVVAGWHETCDEGEDTCENVFAVRMGVGTTTGGIPLAYRVSNPGGGPASTGPSRKVGKFQEVAIDEAGNATMAWDASDSSITGDEYWSATISSGVVSPSVKFGTNTEAVDGELKLLALDGSLLAAWVRAEGAGENSSVYLAQGAVGAPGVAATWADPVAVSPSTADSDQLGLAASAGGRAAVVFRSADRTWANTNAAKDITRPVVTAPANGARAKVAKGVFPYRMVCGAMEANCFATIKATMTVRTARGRLVSVPAGVGSWTAPGGKAAIAKVKLTPAAKLKVGTAHVLNVKLTMVTRDVAGNKRLLVRGVRLTHTPGA